MRKKKRSLIMALCALVVLCGLYAALTLGEGAEERESEGETIAVTGGKTVVSLAMEPEGEKAYTVLVNEEAEPGGRSIWLKDYEDAMMLNVNEAGKLLATLETLKAYQEVEGEPERYGIGPESGRTIVNFDDGTSLTLLFGGDAPVAGRAYVQTAETRKIYVIRKDVADLCNRPATALREAQLAADFFGTTEGFSVERIELFAGPGAGADGGSEPEEAREAIAIRKQTEGERAASRSDAPPYYKMEKPMDWECSDGKVDADVVAACLAMDEQAAVVEDFPTDLSRYGLSDGCGRISIRAGGRTCDIMVGSETKEGAVYVMRRDIPSVAAVPKDSLSMLRLRWYDLIDTSIWMRSIDKIASVTVETPAGVYELKPVRDQAGAIRSGMLNEREIEEKELRDLYMKVLDVHIEGLLEEGAGAVESGGGPAYRITLHQLSGEDESASFYEVDARRYAIEQAGSRSGFYTGAAALSELEKSL